MLRCQLFLSLRSRIWQESDCSFTNKQRELSLDQRFLAFFVSFILCQMKKVLFTPIFLVVHKFLLVLRWSSKKKRSPARESTNFYNSRGDLKIKRYLSRKQTTFCGFSTNFRRFGWLAINFRNCPLFGQRNYGATANNCNTKTFLRLKIEGCFSDSVNLLPR